MLEQYLGLQEGLTQQQCVLHSGYTDPGTSYDTPSSGVVSDAQRLLSQAYAQLQRLDPSDQQYMSLFNACAGL